MYSSLARDLARHFTHSVGAATRNQIAHRWSDDALRAAVRSGDLVRVLPEVFAGVRHAQSWITRTIAANLWAGEDGVIIGAAAAKAWGAVDDEPQRISVTAPRGRNAPDSAWLRLARLSTPIPHHQVELAPGFPVRVATPAFALVTTGHDASTALARNALFNATQRGLTTVEEIAAAMESLPRVNGRRRLIHTLEAIAQGAESHLEEMGLRQVFNTQDFAHLLRQHRVFLGGERYRLDMFDPRSQTAIELDGGTHGEASNREYDIHRDAVLAAHGILSIRFSFRHIASSPERCRDLVRRAISQRLDLMGIQDAHVA